MPKTIYFSILTLFSTFLFMGCSSKVTVKTLHPSSVKTPLNYVFLEQFTNDEINQTNYLENEIANASIKGKRIFTIMPSHQNIDGIISGEVLESSLNYKIYYDKDTITTCIKYIIYDDNKKKCVRYVEKRIPCEKRDYVVKTQVKVLDNRFKIMFSKIYTKRKSTDECYKDSNYNRNSFFLNRHYYDKEKRKINSELAKDIAEDIIKDIAPHYISLNIEIIESLSNRYSENLQIQFENIVKILEKEQIELAKIKLEQINLKLNNTSHEVLYNLGLVNEVQNKLEKAKEYYIKASNICDNEDNLILINKAINRIFQTIRNTKEAKSQLANI